MTRSSQIGMDQTAVVGLELAKQALWLLAVEPRLKGALIAAGPGAGKSVLARAFTALLGGGRLPCVELPLGVTEDRLLGGLDLARTLAAGARQAETGLIAAAHGGVLYVDEINLLDPRVAQLIGAALAEGAVALEREGLSRVSPAEFQLVGTYDPAEGEVAPSLADRVGLLVTEGAAPTPEARVEVMRRALGPTGAGDEARLDEPRARIAAARALLPAVRLARADGRRLAQAARALEVEGQRADIFAARAARASAALAGRDRVAAADLELAVRLVLLPRAQTLPVPEPQPPEPRPPEPQPRDPGEQPSGGRAPGDESPGPQRSTPDADLMIQALETSLPAELLSLPRRRERRAATGGGGQTLSRARGRYVTSVPGRPGEGKVAVDATLRAAAPHQRARRGARAGIVIETADLRLKQFKKKAGTLFIFVVDASGSMAVNRMHQAKGAVVRLLREAYLRRDQVALISFRGRGAETLLAPSRSIARARRALEALPVGGGTPLSAGLLAALQLADRARRAGARQIMLVLLTDGRANVARDPATGVAQEVAQAAAALRRAGAAALVIDTKSRFTSRGEARALAAALGGRYFHLPRAAASEIYQAVAAAREMSA